MERRATISRDELMRLLGQGEQGVREWNRLKASQNPLIELDELDFSGMRLVGIDFSELSIGHAKFCQADLTDAFLLSAVACHSEWQGANLTEASLSFCDLTSGDFRDCTMRGASIAFSNCTACHFDRADCTSADFKDSDLRYACFEHANLTGADLSNTVLEGAEMEDATLHRAKLPPYQIPEGALIVWAPSKYGPIKLLVPTAARRTGNYVGRRYRAEFAEILELPDTSDSTCQNSEDNMPYRIGQRLAVDDFDPDPRIDYGHGIIFFNTKDEARAFTKASVFASPVITSIKE